MGSGPALSAGRGDLVGRVIAVRHGGGLAGARVRVSPGDRTAIADSTGTFAIRGLRQGRYLVRVSAPITAYPDFVEDSVSVGFDGLRILAALTAHTGDIVCVSSPRKPSNIR